MDAELNLQTQVDKLNRLVEISLVMNSTLQLEPLLRQIMDEAAKLTDAAAASILLMDEKTQQLFFMAFDSGADSQHLETLRRIPVPLQGSIAGTVLTENKTIVLDDVTEHPMHFRQADDQSGFQTESLIALPMRLRDRVIGVLESVNKLDGGWTKEDVYTLEILAAQAAVAIENASLVSKLRTAYQELSQVDKMKNDFIAIASHELRTPLGVILGYASFLKEDAEGDASSHAEAVLNSALRMRQLIEDMTNLRFLKLGEGELHKERISVNKIMRLAVNDVQSMAEAQENPLNVKLPIPAIEIHADAHKMPMALTNLLNNAIKYSPRKRVIELDYHIENGEVTLIVRDQGIGIPKEHHDKIFEEFHQVEDHMTRRHNGMGLGLSIARAVVNAHAGSIWVRSDGQDKGSSFFIKLPLAERDSQASSSQ